MALRIVTTKSVEG